MHRGQRLRVRRRLLILVVVGVWRDAAVMHHGRGILDRHRDQVGPDAGRLQGSAALPDVGRERDRRSGVVRLRPDRRSLCRLDHFHRLLHAGDVPVVDVRLQVTLGEVGSTAAGRAVPGPLVGAHEDRPEAGLFDAGHFVQTARALLLFLLGAAQAKYVLAGNLQGD